MDAVVEYRYIEKKPGVQGGEPVIKGTRTPVRSIVQNWRHGLSAEQIVAALPHLTLAEVHAAMSYYYDNQAEIDDLIEKHRIPEELVGKKLGGRELLEHINSTSTKT